LRQSNLYSRFSRHYHNSARFIFHGVKVQFSAMRAQCEITAVAHVEDMVGYPCSNDASAICSDCGSHLCEGHTEHCQVCNEVFCFTCLGFHKPQKHSKKDALPAEIAEKMKKKSA
jgi:hypothetical protein